MSNNGSTRFPVKPIALIVVVGGMAAYWLATGDDELSAIPDDAASVVAFKCISCDHSFELTSRKLVEAQRSGRSDPVEGTSQSILSIPCPQCAKVTARRAQRCPDDGTVFLADRAQGGGTCPKCNWPEKK